MQMTVQFLRYLDLILNVYHLSLLHSSSLALSTSGLPAVLSCTVMCWTLMYLPNFSYCQFLLFLLDIVLASLAYQSCSGLDLCCESPLPSQILNVLITRILYIDNSLTWTFWREWPLLLCSTWILFGISAGLSKTLNYLSPLALRDWLQSCHLVCSVSVLLFAPG